MSEQSKQDMNSQSSEVEDDPLAELARIVAGEPELNPVPQADFIQPVDESVDDDVVVESDVSMEAALEEQLMQEFSVDDAPVASDEIETPSFVEDINSSIDQINQIEPTAIEPDAEPFFAEPVQQEPVFEAPVVEEPIVEEVVEAVPEIAFQDDLINALELEVVGQPAVSEITQSTAIAEPIAEPTEIPPIVSENNAEAGVSELNMQEALEQELAMQFEAIEPQPDPVALEPAPIDTPVASLEDDLGAAFTNEFEQIAANQSEPAIGVLPVVDQIVPEELPKAPVMESIEIPDAEEAIQGDLSLELDFEAAFTQELDGIATPDTPGWQDNGTANANAAFSAAVSPQPVASVEENFDLSLESIEPDPGHVGSIDEIEAVDAAVVASNDNGGGKKYAIAALVIALFAGAIAAGYGFLGSENTTIASGTPDIIKADAGPVKVKPKDPGGIVPENQDNASYVDLGGENTAKVSQETLTSKTEEPLILNTGNSEPVKSNSRLTSSDDAGATPNAASPSILPKVVQTVVVKPDGTIIQQPVTAKPVEIASNSVVIGDPAIVEVKPVSTKVIKKPADALRIDGARTTGNVTVPSASPLPKPVVKAKPAPAPATQVAAAPKPKKVAPPAAAKSEWVVQVSSQRSAEAAQSSFNTMRNRFSALQGRAMSIQRANVNGATYFRVRVQTASRSDANQLCTRLSNAGGNCFVTR